MIVCPALFVVMHSFGCVSASRGTLVPQLRDGAEVAAQAVDSGAAVKASASPTRSERSEGAPGPEREALPRRLHDRHDVHGQRSLI